MKSHPENPTKIIRLPRMSIKSYDLPAAEPMFLAAEPDDLLAAEPDDADRLLELLRRVGQEAESLRANPPALLGLALEEGGVALQEQVTVTERLLEGDACLQFPRREAR